MNYLSRRQLLQRMGRWSILSLLGFTGVEGIRRGKIALKSEKKICRACRLHATCKKQPQQTSDGCSYRFSAEYDIEKGGDHGE